MQVYKALITGLSPVVGTTDTAPETASYETSVFVSPSVLLPTAIMQSEFSPCISVQNQVWLSCKVRCDNRHVLRPDDQNQEFQIRLPCIIYWPSKVMRAMGKGAVNSILHTVTPGTCFMNACSSLVISQMILPFCISCCSMQVRATM